MSRRTSRAGSKEVPTDRLSIRVDLAGGTRIGPGKIALLEEIARSGSISAAGRVLRMSYRRAWQLVEDLNRSLAVPVVSAAAGGSGGGGASLTPAGQAVIARYRAIETAAMAAAGAELAALAALGAPLAPPAAGPSRTAQSPANKAVDK